MFVGSLGVPVIPGPKGLGIGAWSSALTGLMALEDQGAACKEGKERCRDVGLGNLG